MSLGATTAANTHRPSGLWRNDSSTKAIIPSGEHGEPWSQAQRLADRTRRRRSYRFRRHEAGEDGGSFRLHTRQHPPVDVEREARCGMTEPFADDLERHTSFQQERGVCMAQVMQTNFGSPLRTTSRSKVRLRTSGCVGRPSGRAKTRS